MLRYLILIIILIAFPFQLFASVDDCSDGSCTITCDGTNDNLDFDTAFGAITEGGTISVASGTCVFSAESTSTSANSFNLVGSGIDSTYIDDDTGDSASAFKITIPTGKIVNISGFTFKDQDSKAGVDAYLQIVGSGDSSSPGSFRIYNNKLTEGVSRGIIVSQAAYQFYGLIDNNIIEGKSDTTYQGVSVFGAGTQNGTAWALDEDYGTWKFVYIEDNTFDYSYNNDGALDAYGGAKYTFRYNTVINTGLGHHGCDSGNYRSTYVAEVYENTFSTTVSLARLWRSRGGTAIIFNNTATTSGAGSYSGGLMLNNYRSNDSYGVWGICDGLNPLDGNTDEYGYACLDQVGRGKDQSLNPLYEWDNTINGGDVDFSVNAGNEVNVIIENRDYYNDTEKPSYAPYTYPHPLRSASYRITGGGSGTLTRGTGTLTGAN